MRLSSLVPPVFLLAAALVTVLSSLPAEEVETFGPELVAEGAFLGGDGGDPERPAGWDFEISGDARVLWAEKGFRDKGSAHLACADYEARCSILQKRWLTSPEPCYLLEYACRGTGGPLRVRLALLADDGLVLCRSSFDVRPSGWWRTGRLYLEPFPREIEGELEVSFELLSKGEAWIDAVSLRSYDGPWTRRKRRHDGRLPVRPQSGAALSAPVLFSWPAVPFAEKYVLRLADGRGFPVGRYASVESPAAFALASPRKGTCTWTVSAVAPGGKEYTLVEPLTFEVTGGGKSALSPPFRFSIPGSRADCAAWRALRSTELAAGRLAALPVPSLAPPELPQGGLKRERALAALASRWASASARLLSLCSASAAGVRSAAAPARSLLSAMASAAPAAAPLLTAGARASAALAAAAARSLDSSRAASLCKAVLPPVREILVRASADALDYDAFRLLCAALCARAAGLSDGDLSALAAGASALFPEWFPGGASSPLPSALLADDFPLLYSAARLLADMLPALSPDLADRVVSAAASALVRDFPASGGSSFGDSSPSSRRRAAALLAFLAGKEAAAIPPWAWTGTAPEDMAGLFPLTPEAPAPVAPLSSPFSPDIPAGFVSAGSPLLGVSCSFRASPWGTAPPFGPAQGHFSVFWKGAPLAGFLPPSTDGFPASGPDWRSFAFRQYLGPPGASSAPLSHSADAEILSAAGVSRSFLVEADLAPCFVDFFRSARRTLAFVAPPDGPPLVACRDAFSTWFGSPVEISFRLAGLPEKVDAPSQRAVARAPQGRVGLLVARPEGCGLVRGKGDFKPLGRSAVPSFSVVVRPPKGARDAVTVVFPVEDDEAALRPLPGSDSLGALLPGGGLCAFRPVEGGAWAAAGMVTDAAFAALLPQPEDAFFLFAANASSLDWKGVNLLSADKPGDFELLFENTRNGPRLLHAAARAPLGTVVSFAGGGKMVCKERGVLSLLAPPRTPPRPKAELFKGDKAFQPLVRSLSPARKMVCFPFFLSGSYRLSLSLTGGKGGAVRFRMGDPPFRGLSFSAARRAETNLRGEWFGPVSLVALLPARARIAGLVLTRDFLPQGGFERWKANRPEGFTVEPASLRTAPDEKRVFEGSRSLRGVLSDKGKASISARIPFSGRRISAALRAFLETEGENDLFVRLAVVPVDAAGKKGKMLSGRPLSSQGKWRPVSLSVSLPAGTKEVILSVLVEGRGRFWLDDLSVSD